jgi:hypothetical protein
LILTSCSITGNLLERKENQIFVLIKTTNRPKLEIFSDLPGALELSSGAFYHSMALGCAVRWRIHP